MVLIFLPLWFLKVVVFCLLLQDRDGASPLQFFVVGS